MINIAIKNWCDQTIIINNLSFNYKKNWARKNLICRWSNEATIHSEKSRVNLTSPPVATLTLITRQGELIAKVKYTGSHTCD